MYGTMLWAQRVPPYFVNLHLWRFFSINIIRTATPWNNIFHFIISMQSLWDMIHTRTFTEFDSKISLIHSRGALFMKRWEGGGGDGS